MKERWKHINQALVHQDCFYEHCFNNNINMVYTTQGSVRVIPVMPQSTLEDLATACVLARQFPVDKEYIIDLARIDCFGCMAWGKGKWEDALGRARRIGRPELTQEEVGGGAKHLRSIREMYRDKGMALFQSAVMNINVIDEELAQILESRHRRNGTV